MGEFVADDDELLRPVGRPQAGKVTAIVGEFAGADKVVVQDNTIRTFNDMRGKAFAYSDSSVSEYLLYYMLRVGGIPVSDVQRFGQENLNQATRRHSTREAHGVIGWTSGYFGETVRRPDSKVLMTSDQFRVTMDVVVSGSKALATKREALQAFHDAWFEANKMVFEQPDRAVLDMARWNSGVDRVGPPKDLRDALGEFAQATLADNQAVMTEQKHPHALRALQGSPDRLAIRRACCSTPCVTPTSPPCSSPASCANPPPSRP